MGSKLFVSYKYGDENVENLSWFESSRVRDYVTKFENLIDEADDIYKGESDGEDLSDFQDSTIETKLKSKIFDSSVTIVFISPNMKDPTLNESDQWIPWEVSYSLRNKKKKTSTGGYQCSKPNGLIGVVLPDSNGSYDYYIKRHNCCASPCVGYHQEITFQIISTNQFNKSNPCSYVCSNGDKVYSGDHSYMEIVKWSDFINNYAKYVQRAKDRQSNLNDYKLTVTV